MVDKAVEKINKDKDVVISGIIMPYTVEIAESFDRKVEVVFIFLDSPLKDIKIRLKSRLEKSGEDISLTKIITASRKKRELFLNQFVTRKNSYIIKTSKKSMTDIYEEVVSILEA